MGYKKGKSMVHYGSGGSAKRQRVHMTFLVLTLIVLSSILIGCNGKPKAPKKEGAYIMSVDGTDIVTGETTLKDLKDLGFKLMVSEGTGADRKFYDIDEKAFIQPKSKYMGLYLFKDEVEIASLQVTNPLASSMNVMRATVNTVRVASAGAEGVEILIEGIPVKDITADTIAQHFPDVVAGEKSFSVSNDDYEIYAFVENGAITHLTCRDNRN